MTTTLGPHLDAETTEKYSLGKLSARKTAELEKHLLICRSCQQAVAGSDAYVAAVQEAAAQIRNAEQNQKLKRRVAAR
jgi:anti-sigma factor RsiW